MVSKTATTVTVLQTQRSLGNKSHNGKKGTMERNGNATSQMDVRARENLCRSLASLVFSFAAAQSTPVSAADPPWTLLSRTPTWHAA